MFDANLYEPEHLELALFLDVEDACGGEEALSNALMTMFGWTGKTPLTARAASEAYGVDAKALQGAKEHLERNARSNAPERLELVLEDLGEALPLPLPTLGDWLADYDYTRCRTFSIDALLDAFEVYGLRTPFRARTTEHTKWLVQPPRHDVDGRFVDEVAGKALSIAPLWGVIDVDDFESLKRYFMTPGRPEDAWAAIDACQHLATMDGTTLVISRLPHDDAKIVQRLDRLLAWHGAVPLPIALKQITRDGPHGVLPVCDLQTFEAFVQRCAWYDIEDDDVVTRRSLIVDEELSARDKPVVLALVERPAGATISELAAATPRSVDDERVREVVVSSPLIVALPDDHYALLDPSMYDAMLEEDQAVTAPEPVTPVTPATERMIDLAGLGRSGTYWWAMFAGQIHEGQLQGALQAEQKYMPILEPGTGRCFGMVRTSRVYNKRYRGGIPTVMQDDKGLRGKELPRLVPREELLDALSEAPFVFYNDPTKRGQESWGIVQRQDIGWW
jgi:hypothetical protein